MHQPRAEEPKTQAVLVPAIASSKANLGNRSPCLERQHILFVTVSTCGMHQFDARTNDAEPSDLPELWSKAIELVNQAREQHGLLALQSRPELDRAAQAHAEDMLNHNYFDHVSPEGKTVFDRYVEAGGSRWRLVAENIGRCATCKGPPRISDVTRLQDGWMRKRFAS